MKGKFAARAMMTAGLALGAGLVIYGGWRLAEGDRKPAAQTQAAAPALSEAVVAARPISRGQRIAAEDLRTIRIAGPAPAGVLNAPTAAVGRIAAVDHAANQFVLSDSLTDGGGQAGLATLVPAGHRAIGIDVNEEIAVAHHLKPGDLVDVQVVLPAGVVRPTGDGPDASESRTLLQNIRILSITSGQSGDDATPAGARPGRTLTVAMTPEQVSTFALARAVGRYYLALRNPTDQAVTPAALARVSDLRGGAQAPATASQRPAAAPRARTAPAPIELVVGGRREWLRPGGAP